jgi:hypothetical protein
LLADRDLSRIASFESQHPEYRVRHRTPRPAVRITAASCPHLHQGSQRRGPPPRTCSCSRSTTRLLGGSRRRTRTRESRFATSDGNRRERSPPPGAHLERCRPPRQDGVLAAPPRARHIMPAKSRDASMHSAAPCVVRALSPAYFLAAGSSGNRTSGPVRAA